MKYEQHQFFEPPKTDEIWIFVKGIKNFHGYYIYDSQQNLIEKYFGENEYSGVNMSEFSGLNFAIKSLTKSNSWSRKRILKIYSNNLENIVNIIAGKKNPGDLRQMHNEYMNLTNSLNHAPEPIYIRKSINAKTKSHTDGANKQFAKNQLDSLFTELDKIRNEVTSNNKLRKGG